MHLMLMGSMDILGYIDNPPLYFSPIFAHKPFYLCVKYFITNDNTNDEHWEITEESFTCNYAQNRDENSIDSSYFYGRFIKIPNIFSKLRDVKFCMTKITYFQELDNVSLRNRPVFFIPDYRIDKLIRVVEDHNSVEMSENDLGETFYDSTIKKTLTWNGENWAESDGISANIPRTGSFSEAPNHSDVYPGFHYFCTSGAVINGIAKANIDIISTGTEWVDSQGNTVR